jgi:uncharacterized membrane protein YccC
VSPGAFFARELAPSHRRIIEAARNATKATITAGFAATMQILGPFGPLFAFRIGQPGISLSISEGAITIAIAAAVQAAIVPITGALLDYPGLIIAFLFVVFTAVTYLSSNTRLFMLIALTAVGTITTVYVGIFEPGRIGWGSTYTFDGILVATLVMVAVDRLIWPSPPEPRLLESVAADFERMRARFQLVGKRYLDPLVAPLPAPKVTSMLARNLLFLKSVKEQMKPTPERLANLLDAVVTAERAYLEVERLAVLADEPGSDEIRQNHREAIEGALQALDKAFAERTADLLEGLPGRQDFAERVSDLHVTIQRLSELSAQARSASDESTPSGPTNLAGFVSGLETIGNLLDSRERPPGLTTAVPSGAETDSEPRPLIDPAALRFSIKVGTAITLGLLVGLTTQRADLQTILWSTVVAGLPNQYGAVVRKTLLRLTGCILGGLAALAAMMIVSQNFDSLAPYLVVIFVVTMFSTYVAQSSEWLSYGGIQAGITFLICYVGLAPSSNVYAPLWRFWGIILGVATTSFVFLALWPEYASDKLIESLEKLMRAALAFGKDTTEGKITAERITAVERGLSANLLEVLTMADQARFEGRRGVANSSAAIEAAITLIRIAYRFENISRGRLSGLDAILPQAVLERRVAFEHAYCATLESQLIKLVPTDLVERPAAKTPRASETDLTAMADEVVGAEILESTRWAPEIRSIFVAEMESYRRFPALLVRLDAALSKLAAS